MKVIFITGATGNMGSRLVAELVKSKDVRLKLLVRGSSQKEAAERLYKILDFWDADKKAKKKIGVVQGDITFENLGIGQRQLKSLVKQVTHIIHFAAILKLNLPEEEAKKLIFDGTKNVVELAKKCQKNGKFRRFNYISTMEVTGNLSGVICEEFLTNYKRDFLNTYELAKSRTEDFLKDEIKKGLPVTIYRPSMLVGDSKSGKLLHFQSFYYMIEDMFLNPKFPILPGTKHFMIDAISVDFIAKAIECIYDDNDSVGKIYHLTAGIDNIIYLPDFIRHLQEVFFKLLGRKIKPPIFISPRIYYFFLKTAKLFALGKLKRKIEIQLIFIKFFFLRVKFDNSRMKEIIERNGLKIPKLQNYLYTLCKYYLEHKNDFH